jgi:outer membrane protein TolC
MGVESPQFPTAVTFNFYDARAARLEQSAFDLVRIENLHGATENLHGAREEARNARDLIVLAVSGSYLEIMATEARITATEAEVETARAVYQQAEDRRIAGLAPAIDAARARVQLQIEQQHLRSLQADFETQKLRLARIIGLPLGQQFAPVDNYTYSPFTAFTQEAALQRAMAARTDLQAAASGVRAAQDALKASRAERLPNFTITADVGAAGRTPTNHSTSVYSVAGTLTVPIYEGGRIGAEVQQASAALTLRKSQYEDLRAQVDQDVRQAFIDLNAAADQVEVARSNVGLANDTLTQSRDRFAAGVTDTVELVQAEQAVVQANDDYIAAVLQHNFAKVSLARAVGNADQVLPQLLRKADDRNAP